MNSIDLTPYLDKNIVRKIYLQYDFQIVPKSLRLVLDFGTLSAWHISCPITCSFLRRHPQYIKTNEVVNNEYIKSNIFDTDVREYIHRHFLLTDIREKINNYFKEHQYLCTINPSGKLNYNINDSIIKKITKHMFSIFRNNFNEIIVKTYDENESYRYNSNFQRNILIYFINTINYPAFLLEKYNLKRLDAVALIKHIIYSQYDYIESYINEKFKNIFDKELENIPDNINKKSLKATLKLNEYLNNNLKSIFLELLPQWEIDNDKMYAQSWIDNEGLTDGYVQTALEKYLIDNKQKILSALNINEKFNDEEWEDFVYFYTERENRFVYKLNKYILLKNQSTRFTRAKDLLTLNDDDKIGVKNSTSIDYDITNDHVRTNPIVIVNDINTNKDYVLIGPKGWSHGFYILERLDTDCNKYNINQNNYKMGYGYLLKDIAFVDEQGDALQVGYTFEEEVNILKNDPRIKKVYTTPGRPAPNGGPITRLAKLV